MSKIKSLIVEVKEAVEKVCGTIGWAGAYNDAGSPRKKDGVVSRRLNLHIFPNCKRTIPKAKMDSVERKIRSALRARKNPQVSKIVVKDIFIHCDRILVYMEEYPNLCPTCGQKWSRQ